MIDLTHLQWQDTSLSGSSFGMLSKSEEFLQGKHIFYKLSRMQGSHVVGTESIVEYLVSRYLDVLELPHVQYSLLHAKVLIKGRPQPVFLCASKDYKQSAEEVIPVQEFCSSSQRAEQELRNIFGNNCLDIVYLVDFLIANTDRHGYNLEIVQSARGACLAPLFDHGSSLLHWAVNEDSVKRYDVLADVPTNNYVGSESLYSNLDHLASPVIVNPLSPAAKSYIFYRVGPGVLPRTIRDKAWELIWRRYNYAREKGFLIERRAIPTNPSSYFASS